MKSFFFLIVTTNYLLLFYFYLFHYARVRMNIAVFGVNPSFLRAIRLENTPILSYYKPYENTNSRLL